MMSKRVAVKPENVELSSYSMVEQKPENNGENPTAPQHGELKAELQDCTQVVI